MNGLLYDNLTVAAKQRPDAEAFRCGRQTITFSELDAASSRFAAVLIEQGIQQGELIGLRSSASIDAAIAVYGILKAGAVYVPIDPFLPDERIATTLNEYKIRCLVAPDAKLKTLLILENRVPALSTIIGSPASPQLSLQCIPWAAIADQQPCESIRVNSDSPAYVISTSGSTGEPKGIVHTHDSGQSYAELTVETYNLSEHDRIASLSPLHFDMATFGFFAGVLAQATVVLVPPAYTRLPASLSSLIEAERITVWYSVPFALIQVLERGVLDQRDCSTLRWVVFAGEVFPQQLLLRLRRQWPHVAFSNAYGPAETNVCTVFNMPPRNTDHSTEVEEQTTCPIGQAWGNMQTLILDDMGEVAHFGGSGELLVSGPTMMQKYFCGTDSDPDVFFFQGSTRFYKTGDFVQQMASGDLIYLGRKDRQVKVRGHRIELEAIESELGAHRAIEECAVVCLAASEANELYAIVTISITHDVSPQEILNWLKNRLPDYAIPTRLHIASQMQRTSSGKLDRRAIERELLSEFHLNQPQRSSEWLTQETLLELSPDVR